MNLIHLEYWHNHKVDRVIERHVLRISSHYVTIEWTWPGEGRFRIRDGYPRGVQKDDSYSFSCWRIRADDLAEIQKIVVRSGP